MKCQFCGSEIPVGAKVCPNCFAPVEEEADKAENPNPFAHNVTQTEEQAFSYHGGPDHADNSPSGQEGQFDPRHIEPSGQRFAPMGYEQNNQPGGMQNGQVGAAPYGQPGGMQNGQAGQDKPPYSHGRKYAETYGGFNQTNIDRMNGKTQNKGSKSVLFIIIGAVVLVGLLAVIAVNAAGSRGGGSGSEADVKTFSFTNSGTPGGTAWGDDINTVQSAIGGEIIGDDEALYLEDVVDVENLDADADVICSFDSGLYDVAVKYDSDSQEDYDELLKSLESRFGTAEDYTFSADNGWSETITSDDGEDASVDLSGSQAKSWDLGKGGLFLTRDSSDESIVLMSSRFD